MNCRVSLVLSLCLLPLLVACPSGEGLLDTQGVGIARYQQVETRPTHFRQGICGTLVYRSAQIMLEEGAADVLVMEADADYHAAAIYESVGFQRTERNFAFYHYWG